MVRYTLFGLIFMLCVCTAPGQTISFFRQFTTPGIDRATAVAVDSSGIYVIGNRPSPGGGLSNAGVRKYDSAGNELWTREFSVPAFGNVTLVRAAADATGVYVLGSGGANGQFVLRKYSAGGDELWTRQLEFSAPGDLAVDAGGVYVAGRDFPPNATYLRKYNPDGLELWTRRWGDRNNLNNPHQVTADVTSIYVFGIAGFNGGSLFIFARKYDSGGNELWDRQLEQSFNPFIAAAADGAGFYVAGYDRGPFLRRYDAGGDELWTRQLGTSVGAIAVDATGVYVAGTTNSALPGQCSSGSGGDSFVRKYGPDGAEVWTRQFGTADAAWASSVAVDASGVYVVGQEGTAMYTQMIEDEFGTHVRDVFAPANPTRGAFLAKFEKTAATVTASRPRIFPGCVVNAASYLGGGVAPGEIVTLFGSAIGPPEPAWLRLADGRLATTLADARVLFDGVPAPLLYVSDRQSSAIVPYAVAGRSAVNVQVEYKGVPSEVMTVPVLASRPGIFSLDGSGQGQGAILNEDGSLNSPSNPAQRGSIITLYATGGGEAAPGVEDGQILSGVLPQTSLPVSAFFEISKQAEVLYAGGASGSVAGLLPINVRVPANLEHTGNAVPFLLIIGSHWTWGQVTVALR